MTSEKVLQAIFIWMEDEAKRNYRLYKNPELGFPWPLIYKERRRQLLNIRRKILRLSAGKK